MKVKAVLALSALVTCMFQSSLEAAEVFACKPVSWNRVYHFSDHTYDRHCRDFPNAPRCKPFLAPKIDFKEGALEYSRDWSYYTENAGLVKYKLVISRTDGHSVYTTDSYTSQGLPVYTDTYSGICELKEVQTKF